MSRAGLFARLGALCAVAVALAPAGGRAAPCALAVSAEPSWLDLGDGAGAILRVRGASAPPRLTASAGRVENLRPDGEAGWLADYRPPSDPWPQVALVVALEGERYGAVAIPLHGHGLAEVLTLPDVDVSVTIGARTFGPVRTDADGRARVPVVVAPGVTTARHGLQLIPLDPPPLRRVYLAADADTLRADLRADLLVVAAVTGEDGGPFAGGAPALEADDGAVEPAGACDGAFAFRWRLEPGAVRAPRLTGRLEPLVPPGELFVRALAPPPEYAPPELPAEELPEPRAVDLAASVRAGAALRPGSELAPEAGLELAAFPRRLGGRLGVAVEGAFSTFSRETDLDAAGARARVTGRAELFTAGLSAVVTGLRGPLALSLSGGPGLTWATTRVEQAGEVTASSSAAVPELHAAVAAGLRTARGTPFAVLRVAWQGDLAGTSLAGPLRTFSLGVGWRLDAR